MVLDTLRSYKQLWYEAQRAKDVYIRLNEEVGIRGLSYDTQPSGTGLLSQTERDGVKLADAMNEYLDKYNRAVARMIEIDKMIQKVSDSRGQYVLHERYIKFRAMEEIAGDDMVDRSRTSVYRYHDQAVEELEVIYGQ